jgi:membrane protease YdiL (CAAX protease family)
MDQTVDTSHTNKNTWVILGIGYAGLVTAIAAYINYVDPYDPTPTLYPTTWQITLWVLCYIPLAFPLFTGWKIKNFGFSVNPVLVLSSILLSMVCGSFTIGVTNTWYGGLFEAFARTGEEFLYRGFLFLLLLKVLDKKPRSWIWAVIGSSLAFTTMHTQTFQASVTAQLGTGPVVFLVAQRLLNIFLLALVLAMLRYWTKSILPGAIMHSLLQTGIVALPFVFVIYAIITYWAYRRKENIFSGFEQWAKATL